MVLSLRVDKNLGKIVIRTDDPSVRYLLEVTTSETKFIPWKKSWGVIKTTTKVYDNKRVKPDSSGFWNFECGLGWAAYLINALKPYISQDDFEDICKNAIYSDSFRTFPFPELRDYQNEDALHLLKYRIGLMSCYTSYGRLICRTRYKSETSGKNGEG